MNDAMSAFWWGDSKDQKKMPGFLGGEYVFQKSWAAWDFEIYFHFNMAMLSKQTWRLLNNPDSLCAQVLRAKYYPDGKLLNAGPKKGSSYTWQSIFAGLQTFKRGHIWRVGLGEKN